MCGSIFPPRPSLPTGGYWPHFAYGNFNGVARCLTLKECRLITGGSIKGFQIDTRAYVQHSVSSATTPTMQLLLIQLMFGLFVSSVGDGSVGQSARPMGPSHTAQLLCLGSIPTHSERHRRNGNVAYSRMGEFTAF